MDDINKYHQVRIVIIDSLIEIHMLQRVLTRVVSSFSSLKVPIVDVEPFLKGQAVPQDCKTVA